MDGKTEGQMQDTPGVAKKIMKREIPRKYYLVPFFAALLAALWYLLFHHAYSGELAVLSETRFKQGGSVKMLVFARDARKEKPLAGQTVRVTAKDSAGKTAFETSVATGTEGEALVELPANPDVSYSSAQFEMNGVQAIVPLTASPPYVKTMIALDKPIYRPGETVRFLLRGLDSESLKPAAGKAIDLELKDSEDNKLLSQKHTLSAQGLASGEFRLDAKARQGSYAFKSGAKACSDFEVKDYKLPALISSVSTPRSFYAPGETVEASVHAEYSFGLPAANAKIELSLSPRQNTDKQVQNGIFDPFRGNEPAVCEISESVKLEGRADERGDFKFQFKMPALKDGSAADAMLRASPAGAGLAEGKSEITLRISAKSLSVKAFPADGGAPRGRECEIFIRCAYPDDSPAKAKGRIQNGAAFETDENGLALVKAFIPKSGRLLIEAKDESGIGFDGGCDVPSGAFSIATPASVVKAGDVLPIELTSSLQENGKACVELAKDGRAIAIEFVQMRSGKGSCRVKIPEEVAGTLLLKAFAPLADGSFPQSSKLIQAMPSDMLSVEAKLDKAVYAPGEQAKLALSVRGSDGKPRQAALSLLALEKPLFRMSRPCGMFPLAYFGADLSLAQPCFRKLAGNALFNGQEKLAVRFAFSQTSVARTGETVRSESYEEREKRLIDEKWVAVQYGVPALAIAALIISLSSAASSLRKTRAAAKAVESTGALSDETLIFLRTLGPQAWFATTLSALFTALTFANDCEVLLVPAAIAALVNLVFIGICYVRFGRPAAKSGDAVLKDLSRLFLAGFSINITGLVLIACASCVLGDNLPLWPAAAALTACQAFLSVLPRLLFRKSQRLLLSFEAAGQGAGMGCERRSFWAYIAFSPLLGASPVFFIVFTWGIAAMAMFLPFLCVVERLGGGGGYSGSGNYDSESQPPPPLKNPTPPEERVRKNFPETSLWQPELLTDESGKAEISFDVADAIAEYKLIASAGAAEGGLGETLESFSVSKDFFVEFDAPRSAACGDELSLPAYLGNKSEETLKAKLSLEATRDVEAERKVWELELPGHSAKQLLLPVRIAGKGLLKLRLKAEGRGRSDIVERVIAANPPGKRLDIGVGGVAGGAGEAKAISFEIPSDAEDLGAAALKIFPTPLAICGDSLEGMLRMPYGCFEQSSSINYPNIMAAKLLRASGRWDEKLKAKLLPCLTAGYQRLLSFEAKDGGFALYAGEKPALEYSVCGLLQLSELAGIIYVDPAAVKRNANYVRKHLGSCGLALKAYAAYALRESGESGLEGLFDEIFALAKTSDSPYEIAVAANALAKPQPERAKELLARMEPLAERPGAGAIHWSSGAQSVLSKSFAAGAGVETTAIAACALAELGDAKALECLRWLNSKRGPGGTWDSSTQATAQTLRANLEVCEKYGIFAKPARDATLDIEFNGAKSEILIKKEDFDTIRCVPLEAPIRNGTNKLSVKSSSQELWLSYQLVSECYLPKAEKPGALELAVDYSPSTSVPGELVACKVYIKSSASKSLPMGMASVGIPPGFKAVESSLRALVDSGAARDFEIAADRATLYLQDFQPGKPQLLEFSLLACYPVKAQAPRSSAYPYYEKDLETGFQPSGLITIQEPRQTWQAPTK